MIIALIAGSISLAAWASAAYMVGVHKCLAEPNPDIRTGRIIEEASAEIILRRSPDSFYTPMALNLKFIDEVEKESIEMFDVKVSTSEGNNVDKASFLNTDTCVVAEAVEIDCEIAVDAVPVLYSHYRG